MIHIFTVKINFSHPDLHSQSCSWRRPEGRTGGCTGLELFGDAPSQSQCEPRAPGIHLRTFFSISAGSVQTEAPDYKHKEKHVCKINTLICVKCWHFHSVRHRVKLFWFRQFVLSLYHSSTMKIFNPNINTSLWSYSHYLGLPFNISVCTP